MPEMVVVPDVERTGYAAMRALGKHGHIDAQAAVDSGQLIHLTTPIEVGGLPRGMTSGRASVSFCFTLPDGRVVLAETSMRLFKVAADALYGVLGE